jgi:ELWxxDGT repeat protein
LGAVLFTTLACGGGSAIPPGPTAEPKLVLIRDLVPGPASPTELALLGGDGDDAVFRNSSEIWRTQGTEISTQRFSVFPGGVILNSFLAKLPDSLLLSGPSPTFGYEPWRVNSSGASQVLDINPQSATPDGFEGSSYPEQGNVAGSRAFFIACDGTGNQLFSSDGTAPGTRRLAGPFDGINNSGGKPCLASKNIWSPVALGSRLYFLASTPLDGQGLWSSDGTPEGTAQVAQIDPNPHNGTNVGRFIPPPAVADLVVMGGRLYFRGSRDLWQSDGTRAGTVAVTNSGLFPTQLLASANRLYFLSGGIWTSDGTSGGTRFLASFQFPTLNGSPSFDMAALGDKVFHNAHQAATGYELWVTDAKSGETLLLRDGLAGPESSWPTSFIAAGSTMYFTMDDGTGRRVWASDGTPAGTHRLGDSTAPVLAEQDSFVWRSLVRVRGGLVFAGKDTEHGRELWALQTQ